MRHFSPTDIIALSLRETQTQAGPGQFGFPIPLVSVDGNLPDYLHSLGSIEGEEEELLPLTTDVEGEKTLVLNLCLRPVLRV